MALTKLTYIDLPEHVGNGEFDHADIHSATDRLYLAHTSNDTLDVIDIARDQYLESIPGFTAVAGALVSEARGLAFDASRGILIAANVGDPAIADFCSVSVIDVARRERIAEIKVPGRTRWAVYDAARQMFFVNIVSPTRIIAIDARDPTRVSKEFEVPAIGPHGLDLDSRNGHCRDGGY